MARYLTPSKISLLALATLYDDGVIPTTSCVPILGFLISLIAPDGKASASPDDFEPAVPLIVFETALSKHASIQPGRSVYDLLLKRLWSIDCSDALDSFIEDLPRRLTQSREVILRQREAGLMESPTTGRIIRTSPLGSFMRRCHLEYMRLQFQEAVKLWQAFILYRAPTRPAFEKKNATEGSNALDINLSELQIDASHPLAGIMYGSLVDDEPKMPSTSVYDVEKLLEFQVSEMQRLGGRLPDTIRSTLGDMSQAGVYVPKLSQYLKFLDAWRSGDYTSAFDNLHRYFDYTMQSRDRTFYQYALLNLAILQADFGCYTGAIPAMQEAIATARENKDTTCLNFCMSWLYHFGRTFPSEMQAIKDSGILGSETEGLAFLKSRAKDAEMWSLLSTSFLSEARLGLQHGDSLAMVFENIVKASHMNVTKATQNITGPTLLMRSSAFTRVGCTHLAWNCGRNFLQCHTDEAPLEDVLKCTCRMASLLVQKGRYVEARQMMDDVPGHIHRVLKYHNYWIFYSGLLKLRQLSHQDNLNPAEQLAHQLRGQGPPDLEIGVSLSFLEIELMIQRGALTKAMDEVEYLADKVEGESSDIVTLVRLLNLKARIYALAKHPMKGFSIVTRAAQLAYRARVLPSLWESIGILSNILNALREYQAAADLLHAIIPKVLECQDCDLAARTYCYLADATMGLAGEEEGKPVSRKEYVSKTMEHLDAAFQQYKFLEDSKGQLDVLYKKARIMHWRGDLVLANDTASQYMELKKQYEAMKL